MQIAAPVQEQAQLPRRDWCRLELGEFLGPLVGYSRSAERSHFYLPHLKLGLDCGVVNGRQPPEVALTHGHSDHSADLAWVCQRSAGTQVLVPEELVPKCRAYVVAAMELNCCEEFDENRLDFRFIGVSHGQWLPSSLRGGGQLEWEVFKMHHGVPCVGFGLCRRTKKLRDEFRNVPGAELGRLRREGVAIEEVARQEELMYCGDTNVSVLEECPRILEYPRIIIECTFLDIFDGVTEEEIKERCERDGHILWSQLRPFVLANRQSQFILIHFSLRYTVVQIHEFFRGEDAAHDLHNVSVFAGEYRENRYQ